MNKPCLSFSSILLWKFDPRSSETSAVIETSSHKLTEAIKQLLEEGTRADYYEGDLHAPRYFIRLRDDDHIVEVGEVLRHHALIGEEWYATPFTRLWDLLEDQLRHGGNHPKGGAAYSH